MFLLFIYFFYCADLLKICEVEGMSNDDDFCGNTPAGGAGIRDSGYAPESVCAVKRSAQVAG